MGIFSGKKKKQDEIPKSLYNRMTVEEALEYSKSDGNVSPELIKKFANELADQIQYLKTRQDQTKYEFDETTAYLKDIKLLESLSEQNRALVTDAARMIIGLGNERVTYQSGRSMVSKQQYRVMEMYENNIPRKLKEMEKQEEFLGLICDDMHNLEGEKGSINYQKEQAQEKRSFLVKLSYFIILLVLGVFTGLMVLMNNTGKSFIIPFFLTGLAGAGYAAYFVYAYRECGVVIRKSDLMLNRANMILNKVKIKYVNTTNALEYSYEKYGVNSVTDFKRVWENYQNEKKEEMRYRKNSQLLKGYEDNLTRLLREFGFSKTDAWVSQPEYLVNRAEITELKKTVSTRRNKLKAQMDQGLRQQDSTLEDFEALKEKYGEYRDYIDEVMKKNNIQ